MAEYWYFLFFDKKMGKYEGKHTWRACTQRWDPTRFFVTVQLNAGNIRFGLPVDWKTTIHVSFALLHHYPFFFFFFFLYK